jgi:hypothetical protein
MSRTTAAYPMVGEADATGLVAATYRRILSGMPMVPSLFKSLAVCPASLALAWAQTEAAVGGDHFGDTATDLVARAAGTVPPPADDDVRGELAHFVAPLGRMLLATAGLGRALAGELTGPPAVIPDTGTDDGAAPQPERDVPDTTELPDDDLLGRIRHDLASPIVNSIWRHAAARGQLAPAWHHLAPHAASPAVADLAADLAAAADDAVDGLDWPVVASPEAYAVAGAPDAVAGARSIVDAYGVTLPRVLVLVAGCDRDGDRE